MQGDARTVVSVRSKTFTLKRNSTKHTPPPYIASHFENPAAPLVEARKRVKTEPLRRESHTNPYGCRGNKVFKDWKALNLQLALVFARLCTQQEPIPKGFL